MWIAVRHPRERLHFSHGGSNGERPERDRIAVSAARAGRSAAKTARRARARAADTRPRNAYSSSDSRGVPPNTPGYSIEMHLAASRISARATKGLVQLVGVLDHAITEIVPDRDVLDER